VVSEGNLSRGRIDVAAEQTGVGGSWPRCLFVT
jgi:hypothetical protein